MSFIETRYFLYNLNDMISIMKIVSTASISTESARSIFITRKMLPITQFTKAPVCSHRRSFSDRDSLHYVRPSQ